MTTTLSQKMSSHGRTSLCITVIEAIWQQYCTRSGMEMDNNDGRLQKYLQYAISIRGMCPSWTITKVQICCVCPGSRYSGWLVAGCPQLHKGDRPGRTFSSRRKEQMVYG
ncbi:hypothetical protein JOM56_012744 [Amanita muscaria]